MHDRDRFDKFTERARKVLSLAHEEAQRFQHNYIGTEHLLLGLLREGDGIAAKVLNSLGVELDKAREAIVLIIGQGDRIVLGKIGLTPRTKKVIELAVDEARCLNHDSIGTEHLLLGLLQEGQGIAIGILKRLGVNLEKVRIQTLLALKPQDVAAPSTEGNSGLTHSEEEKKQIKGILDDRDERGRFGKFTKQAKQALVYAQEEAQRFQHHSIGTEHLLMGLLREPEDIAVKVLANLGVELKQIRSAIEFITSRGASIVLSEIGPTPRARKAIKLAIDEARRLNHNSIGTEHLLLGLIREGEGIAAGVLESLGVNLEKARTQTLHLKSEK